MSAWVLGLALGAGYLINKNLSHQGILDKAEQKYNSAAEPSTDGATSAEVRTAWANTDFARFGDMQEDLPKEQKRALAQRVDSHRASVEAYDNPPGSVAEIQGVLLTFDRGLG